MSHFMSQTTCKQISETKAKEHELKIWSSQIQSVIQLTRLSSIRNSVQQLSADKEPTQVKLN